MESALTTRRLGTRPGGAYGLWQAVLTLPDGTELVGGGSTEQEAAYRARVQARVPCDGCGRPTLGSEAAVSRRAYRGEVLCHYCREARRGLVDTPG
jgi:hypothetical protein